MAVGDRGRLASKPSAKKMAVVSLVVFGSASFAPSGLVSG